jgi:hypothetical protein
MSMTIPTIPSLPAGYVVQAGDMNNLAAAATFLLTKPIVRVRDTANGTTTIGTSPTAIQWGSADINTDGMWSGAHPQRLTIQTPGWYKVRYMVQCGSNNGPFLSWVISTTGSNNPAGSGIPSSAYWASYCVGVGGSQASRTNGSGLWPFYLYSGDYLEVMCQSTSSGQNTGDGAPGVATNGGSVFSLELKSI